MSKNTKYLNTGMKVGEMVIYFGWSVSCDSEEKRYEQGFTPMQNDQKHLIPGQKYKIVKRNSKEHGEYADIQGPGSNGDNIVVSGISISHFRSLNNSLTPNTMSIVNTIKKLARREPEKTFVEVGFMDDAENITEDGKEALFYLLWKDKKDDLKKLADEIIKNKK